MLIDDSDSMQLPIRCFLSYARADDEALDFIMPLKKALEYFCFSDSGRRLEVFVDREAVGWGNAWRDKISESLHSAMVFIPVISLQYFDRTACRAELQAFHTAANNLGVTDLLLPLIVLGHNHVTDASEDPLVRLVEELQYIDISDAVLSGTATKEWRTAMIEVSRKLVIAVEHAEKVIQDRDSTLPIERASEPGEVAGVSDDDPGLYELDSRMEDGLTAFTAHANDVMVSLAKLTPVVNASAARMQDATPDVARAVAADLARDIADVALDMQRAGGSMETAISELDADLRRYYSLVMQFGSQSMKDAVQHEVDGFEDQFSEIKEVMDVLTDFIRQIQPVELLSAPLRKSIRPLRTGISSMHAAMATMGSWTQLGK
jgi:TIR domain-containing protein